MNRELFEKKKEELVLLAEDQLGRGGITEYIKMSLIEVKKILSGYTYDNRHEMKGILTRAIIDSLELEYSVGEKFIDFDQAIR